MIHQKNLDQIKNFLDLEKISVSEKIIIYCFLKEAKQIMDLSFVEKVASVEKQLKQQISPNIELKIIEEGEIENVEQLEFSAESGINGSS
jgi:hypothetical protein